MRICSAARWCGLACLLLASALDAQQQPESKEPFEGAKEVIVVTASRTRQDLARAPAAISVISAQDIEQIPADDYADLLRNVPGLNVSQTSARDINMTARGSTNTTATSQLVLLDGRSIYLDFFGLVMWDFLPVNLSEVRQIEVVRGPGSAVWGANAMTGVVNLITKRPKEMVGTEIVAGAGEVGTRYGTLSHAGVSGEFGYKFSAGYFMQDAYERPTGLVPGSVPAQTYPNFDNTGTEQSKTDIRLDWDIGEDGTFSVGGGYAATDGILHSGIGPFDIDSGSSLSYVQADWNKHAWHVGIFGNFLDADSANLLTLGADGEPLTFEFKTDTYHLDISNTSMLGTRTLLTYGANYRTNEFELEIAPAGTDKDEWGAFLQAEIQLSERLRWVIGGRYDDVDPLEDAVFTPRTSVLISPSPGHTFRLSYNAAFRTPSAINSYLDATILQQLGPLLVAADANGNVVLEEEKLTAYEVGYVGTYDNGVILTLAVYRSETRDSIDFFVSEVYGPGNLPGPSPFLPPAVIPCFNFPPGTGPAACPLGGLAGLVPSDYSYRNIGEITNQGVELSLQQRRGAWNWFLNVSWQDEPGIKGEGVDPAEVNISPEWRGNLGIGYDVRRWFWSANVNYQGEAYWADVLFARASTDAFTQVNVAIGARFLDERLTLQITGANVLDETVQQHIFGDFISRKVTGQLSWRF